jgi:hypothetical protein
MVAEPIEPVTPDPTDLTGELIERLPDLLDTVQAQLARSSPDYAEFLAGSRPEVARLAADAIRRLVGSVQQRVGAAERGERGVRGVSVPPAPASAESAVMLPAVQAELFEVIGRLQYREGQDLARLLSAYQAGAHAAWRYVSSTALRLQVSVPVVTELAEAVFSFVDALTAASARGFVLEQSESAAERERLREELAAKLLSDRCDSTAIALVSDRVGWALPPRATLILVDPEDEVSLLVLGRLGGITLATRWGDWMVVVWPDRPELASRPVKVAMLRGMRAVVSRPLPLDRLPSSVRVMAAAARLRQQELLDEDPAHQGLLFVEDHLDAVIVHRDPRPLQALREQVLAPLQGVPPNTRERLIETLASWLRQMGDRRAMAAELHIHPQTVRYRLGQLRELFGDALDDPRTRTRFTIALLSGAGPKLGADDLTAPDSTPRPPA